MKSSNFKIGICCQHFRNIRHSVCYNWALGSQFATSGLFSVKRSVSSPCFSILNITSLSESSGPGIYSEKHPLALPRHMHIRARGAGFRVQLWVLGESGECNLSHFVDVSIDMPDLLDINHLRARGLQPGEEELPDISPPIVIPDDSKGTIVCQEVALLPLSPLTPNGGVSYLLPLCCPLAIFLCCNPL